MDKDFLKNENKVKEKNVHFIPGSSTKYRNRRVKLPENNSVLNLREITDIRSPILDKFENGKILHTSLNEVEPGWFAVYRDSEFGIMGYVRSEFMSDQL